MDNLAFVRDLIKEKVYENTKYIDRYKKDEDSIFRISASQVGNDSNQLAKYVLLPHNEEYKKKIKSSELGSLMHLSFEQIMKENMLEDEVFNCEREQYFETRLPNGADFTAIADLVVYTKDAIYVIDYKLTKKYKAKMVKAEGILDSYALQLAGIKYLISKETDKPIYTGLCYLFKDNDEKEDEEALVIEEIETLEPDEFEEFVVGKSNEVMDLIVYPDKIEKCAVKNIWLVKDKNKVLFPLNCKYYCKVSGACEHYHPAISEF